MSSARALAALVGMVPRHRRSLLAGGAGPGGDHGRPGAGRRGHVVVADVRPRLPRPALRGAGRDYATERRPPPSGVGVRHRRREPRPGLRAGDVGRGRAGLLLRVEQPRRGAVRRAGLRRDDGRAADRAPQGHRRRGVGDRGRRLAAGLQHHGRAAGGQRHGPDRSGGRRVRHPRLREGLRRADRRAALDDLHHPRAGRAGERDVARRHLEARRRSHLDHRRLRSRAEPGLLEHRQRGTLELPRPQGRQPVVGRHRRHRRRQRRHPLGIPVHPVGTAGTTTPSARRCWPT